MLIRRLRFSRPTVGMEVALGRAIERWVFWVLAAMVVFDVLQALSEVFVMVWFASICLKDNVGEEGGQLTFANLSLSQTQAGIVLTAEFREETSCNNESFVSVELVMKWEEVLEVFLAKDLHDASHVFFVLILDTWTALECGRVNSPLSFGVLTIRNTVLDSNALILVKPIVAGPDAIFIGAGERGNTGRHKSCLHLDTSKVFIKIL